MGCNVSVPDPPAVSPAPPVVHKSPPSAAPSSAPTKQNSSSSNGAVATMTIQVPRGARPGMVLQAKTPHGTLVQFKVPVGVAPGQTFQAQYPITNSNVIDEESKNQKSVATHLIPSYWTNVKIPGNTAFDQMVYIDRQQHDTFNTLLSESYFAKATRDRPCPRGSCPKTAGGCPCVQPGGSPGLPTQYIVRRVVRVEDSSMWAKYVERREAIAENRMMRGEMPLRSPDPPIKTDEVCDQYSQVFEQLDNELNEVYLWHGTNVRAALSIAANDFRVDLAGSNTGTMYGRGAYMAESCTKADEYATDEPGGYYEGVYAMLLCRVCLGKFYYTEHRNEEAGSKVKSGEYDSTLGDRAKSVGTFREFVVYDADAVYPEYVIIYSRVHEADDMQRIDTLGRWSFHMQLPVYWANCYKNPAEESFFEQYRVRTHTVQLLQKLLQSCYKQGKLKVKSARRVENSNVWNSYVQFKQQLNQQLGGFTNSFTPPHELDGDASSGHIMTHAFLTTSEMEESISVSNLDERLNETLLWHGTSREAAEKIISDDFYIPVGKAMKHAARFGNGAYFAEDAHKSFTYADDTPEGTKIILLCRVLCGDFYYTEAHTQIDGGQRRENEGKHSVLANPEKRGPREIIVPLPAQVYPEFVLEVEIPDWVQPPPARMQKTKMQITVPPGFSPGQMMTVRLPDGREVSVSVPANAQAGTKLEIEL